MVDLKDCIYESLIISDIDNQLDKVDAEMEKYETNLRNVKVGKREIIKRCSNIMERSKQAANITNTNNQNISNTKPFKTQPELNSGDKSLCKELRKIIKSKKIEQFISKSNRDQSIEEIFENIDEAYLMKSM